MSNEIALNYAQQIEHDLGDFVQKMRNYQQGEQLKLYKQPGPEDWTVMENLAHLAEFPPYWILEFLKIARNPGQPYGRTHDDPDRIDAVSLHAKDEIGPALDRIEKAQLEAVKLLMELKDEDWEKTGVHPNRGVWNLRQMMDFFVIKHIHDHIQQTDTALIALNSKKQA